MSEFHDLKAPEAVGRLRHRLRTPLNQIIGYADLVYRQAKDQGASREMELMEEVIAAARRMGDMIAEALPASSHVGEGSIPRLRAAMQGHLDHINEVADRFQRISQGVCEMETGKIRQATRQLLEFTREAEPPPSPAPKPAPGRVFEMPAAGTAELSQGEPRKAPEPEKT